MMQKIASREPLLPGGPLWRRAPTRDDAGKRLSDFMLLIPGLRQRPQKDLHEVVRRIDFILDRYRPTVTFADLNLELNVLWVTVRPVPGACRQIVLAIQDQVPEALLVASRFPADPFATPKRRFMGLLPGRRRLASE
jgi:hypothetical protein